MKRLLILTIILLLLVAACRPSTAEPTDVLVIPTAIATLQAETPAAVAATSPTPTPSLPVPPTFQPDEAISDQQEDQPIRPETTLYQVAFVADDDTLNVRSGPGVDYGVRGELAPDADEIEITGPGQLVSGSTWVPIAADNLTGWVNSRFLVHTLASEDFCQDEDVNELLSELETAVTDQDNDHLAQLVHPERGLRIHHTWWNPEILVSSDEVKDIFTSDADFDWGVQDGSGDPIVGSFNEVMIPLLQEDLLLATETSCDEIIHGGTAGLVRLPDGYDPVHYFSLHRPGTEEFAGMNWGTWVVGVEQWQGSYYISFLLHFQWEI